MCAARHGKVEVEVKTGGFSHVFFPMLACLTLDVLKQRPLQCLPASNLRHQVVQLLLENSADPAARQVEG